MLYETSTARQTPRQEMAVHWCYAVKQILDVDTRKNHGADAGYKHFWAKSLIEQVHVFCCLIAQCKKNCRKRTVRIKTVC